MTQAMGYGNRARGVRKSVGAKRWSGGPVADAQIRISDAKDKVVLDAATDGPGKRWRCAFNRPVKSRCALRVDRHRAKG